MRLRTEINKFSPHSEKVVIPTKYAGLPSEVVEGLWPARLYADPERNKIEQGRRQAALELIRKKELDREATKEKEAGEAYGRLSEKNKQEFPALQQKAASFLAKHVSGTKNIDTKLSTEEQFVLSKLEAAWKDEQEKNPDAPVTLKPEREIDQKILSNLLNKLAFEQIRIKESGADQRRLSAIREELTTPTKEGVAPTAKVEKPVVASQKSPESHGKNWQEVVRVSTVESIGDLNGSYDSFVDHLKAKNLITIAPDGAIEWSGGDSRVVFVGDVLGDRSPEGTKVMQEVARLREAAEKAGGGIDVLAGNHEDYFLSFVAGTELSGHEAGYDGFFGAAYGSYPGVFEFLPYASDEIKTQAKEIFESGRAEKESELTKSIEKLEGMLLNPNMQEPAARKNVENVLASRRDELKKLHNLGTLSLDDPGALRKSLEFLDQESSTKLAKLMFASREEILDSVRNDPEGRKTLESIATLKLATLKDDTLLVHTNLTPGMAALLFENPDLGKSIDDLNQKFQKGLRHFLLGENLTEQEEKEFYRVKNIFLDEFNRENFTESLPDSERQRLVSEFKKKGVNLVLHGHVEENGKTLGTADLPIVSIDRSAYKSGSNKNPVSSLTVEKNGSVQGKATLQTVREGGS